MCHCKPVKDKSMSTSNLDRAGIQPSDPVDPDIAEQAVPNHGVPSQDPEASAQVGLTQDEAERESKSAFVGGGAVAGLAAGAAVGAAVGGPVGVLVGGMVGTIAGVMGGEAAGAVAEPDPEPNASGSTAGERLPATNPLPDDPPAGS